MKHTLPVLLTALLLAPGVAIHAIEPGSPGKLLLHPLFSDDAVLQRDKPLTVWGWAVPGAEVSVSLSGANLAATPVSAKAGVDGRWRAAIGPFAAGGPYVLTARAGAQMAEAKDILIGDVWLCGGQSNMGWLVRNSKDYTTERVAADLPRIRHIQIAPGKGADPQTPQNTISGQWKICTPESVGDFTAVGFYFARELHRDLAVPIGLVNNSVGGTEAERWMSASTLATLPETKKRLADYRQVVADVAAQKARTGKDYPVLINEWYRANDPGTFAQPAWSSRDLPAARWRTVKLPALFKEIGAVPWTYRGTVWVRREFNVPENLTGKRFVLHLGQIHDWDTVWINGRQIGATEDRSWYGINRAYWVFDEKLLRTGSNTIAVRILNRGDSCGIIRPWDGDMRLDFFGVANLPLDGEWQFSPGIELGKAASPLPIGNRGDDQPATLYNTLVAPLAPMTIKGAIWYQGEGNSHRSSEYRALLQGLIGDWRSLFAQGDFPFLIVQLPNWANPPKQPEVSPWADIREAQAQVARTLPACGLTVTIDVGDPKAIHPTNKQPVGHRLALAAKAIAYVQRTEWSGPWYKGMTAEDPSIRLTFEHLGGGLVTSDGAPLAGFAIAGDDRVFTWADARIDGDTVVVSSPQVAKPVAVRYAWATNPRCNLANKAGLPAVPFRTDDWSGHGILKAQPTTTK